MILLRFAGVAMLTMVAVTAAIAQIPNAGFEDWVAGEPVDWTTGNVPGVMVPITQSTDRHSGSFSVRGDVVEFFGFPISPALYSGTDTLGIPVTQRHASLTGWYKLNSVGGDQTAVSVLMYNAAGDSVVGGGGAVLNGAGSFTTFSAPIYYYSSAVPSHCYIVLQMFPADTAIYPHLGSWFLFDDLAFSGISAVEPLDVPLPSVALLAQNFPNPFNPATTIEFQIPQAAPARLEVFTLLGQKVTTLVDEALSAGTYRVPFVAGDLPSGIYLYRLSAGSFVQTRKMSIVK